MKWIWSFIISLTLTLPVLAQAQQRGEQIESVKIAFISRKLDLTTDEAQRFWPLYNNYQKEIGDILKQKKQTKLSNATDPDAQLDGELDFEERILDIRKKYSREFTKVIPSQKVLLLYQAEREFRQQLIKQLKDRRKY
ncbi:MAG: hypothetical protein WBP45_04830 [Daejeonella sp.]